MTGLHDRRPLIAAAVVVAIVFGLAGWALFGGSGNDPAGQGLEAQAIAIEHQLLCPQCTNQRLDLCELAICRDMQALIRERLAAGDPPDEIVLFFRNRYGDRVLAEIPREGFNLLLFGWVGGSVVAVAAIGALVLSRMVRSTAGVRHDSGPAGGVPIASVRDAAIADQDGQPATQSDDADAAWLRRQLGDRH